jgi:probable phosphoglycerate mutase
LPPDRGPNLFVFARHAQSTLNLEHRINGDPSVPVSVTAEGEAQARRLGLELAGLPIDLCIHTRFPRTRRTAEIALGAREVPFREEPLLDDIDIGDLEGKTIAEYHAWKDAHTRADPFPGGESLDDAARRYAEAFRRLGAGDGTHVLVLAHEIPIRYALNALAGSHTLDGPAHEIPNATPYLFDAEGLRRAADRIGDLLNPA